MYCNICGKKIKKGKNLCPECQEKHQKALTEHKDYEEKVSFKIPTKEELQQEVQLEEPIARENEQYDIRENVNNKEIIETKSHIDTSTIIVATFVIGIIIFLYCLIVSHGSLNEGAEGAVWWYFLLYIWSLPFILPIAIATTKFINNSASKNIKIDDQSPVTTTNNNSIKKKIKFFVISIIVYFVSEIIFDFLVLSHFFDTFESLSGFVITLRMIIRIGSLAAAVIMLVSIIVDKLSSKLK